MICCTTKVQMCRHTGNWLALVGSIAEEDMHQECANITWIPVPRLTWAEDPLYCNGHGIR